MPNWSNLKPESEHPILVPWASVYLVSVTLTINIKYQSNQLCLITNNCVKTAKLGICLPPGRNVRRREKMSKVLNFYEMLPLQVVYLLPKVLRETDSGCSWRSYNNCKRYHRNWNRWRTGCRRLRGLLPPKNKS